MIDWIQGDKFKGIADFTYSPKKKLSDDYDNLSNTFDPSKLKEVNIVYTHMMYAAYLISIIQHLGKKFILITHSCDCRIENDKIIRPNGCGIDQYSDLYKLPNNIIAWYSKNVNTINSRIKSIPIGLENDRWFPQLHKKEKMIEKLDEPPMVKNLAYMCHNQNTHPERKELYGLFKGKFWITIEQGSNGSKFDEYLDNIYHHQFVICPQGNGIDTHRTWECLYTRTIPIEKRNINNQFYTDLPICFVDDWEEVTEGFLQKELIRIKNTKWNMQKLTFEYWKNKILTTV
jgi:hypothetical protein